MAYRRMFRVRQPSKRHVGFCEMSYSVRATGAVRYDRLCKYQTASPARGTSVRAFRCPANTCSRSMLERTGNKKQSGAIRTGAHQAVSVQV